LQAQLEICLVRMPNQNLADEEARKILEFMRQNDGVQ
jgi:pyruvate-formate lyase-activating enzyme